MPSEFFQPPIVSIVVTTHRFDSYYTQACLESIRRWKNAHHQLIVISHDESALLRAYLEACRDDGLIDRLLYAVPNHGHTRSFNLGVRHAHGNEIFNVGNDILIGPSMIDDCAYKLRNNPQLGLIGWHWYNEGTFWQGDKVREFALHDDRNPLLSPENHQKLRSAPWYTGRLFQALGRPLQLRLCNTSFFGTRRETLERVGGGFGPEFQHYFADDALCYAVLDLGLDVHHFERKFRNPPYFREFQYENTDVTDRNRHGDFVRSSGVYLDSIRLLGGGMTEAESIFLHLLAKAIPNGSTVTGAGVWLGSSAIVLLDALRGKRIHFEFIDCFDLPGISGMSGQPPVCQTEFVKNLEPYIGPGHSISITRANTLEMRRFPQSDFVFLDAGHTAQCVAHDARLVADCLNPGGTAAFHDYGSPHWQDVKPEVDGVFGPLECHETVGVFRHQTTFRLSYEWP